MLVPSSLEGLLDGQNCLVDVDPVSPLDSRNFLCGGCSECWRLVPQPGGEIFLLG